MGTNKDFFGHSHNRDEEVDALFYSRPLVLPGSAFGALNFFFDPNEISAQEVEHLGRLIAEFVDNYCIEKEKRSRVTN